MNEYLFTCEKNNEKVIYESFQTNFNNKYEEKDVFNIHLGHNIYHKEAVIEEIDIIISVLQREWFLFQTVPLNDVILSNEEMLYARTLINKSFVAIKECLQICECPIRKERYKKTVFRQLKCLFNNFIHTNKMQDDFIVKLSSWKENAVKTPIYQYFHIFLEVQYYLLFLSYICESPDHILEDFIENIMSNFIQLSKKNYQRKTDKVFVCPCVKHFWILIQLFLEKIKDNDSFWKIFNKKMEHEEPMFSLWLLKEIAELQLINEYFQNEGNICNRIRPNYDLLHSKLKAALIDADSNMLLKIFKLMNPLLTNYWIKNAKIEVYQIIWDFYSKRLNISNQNYSNLTAIELYNSLSNIISSPKLCNEDFENFLGILICHLREHPDHWGKMKGRIYSQLGPHKIKDLNYIGMVHVMFLFASLSTLNYEELLKKILAFLEGLPQEKRNNQLTWNICTTFIFMQVKGGLTVERIAELLLSWIQEASLTDKNFHLIKTFIANYEHILNFSSHMKLHQWILLNYWLSRYLTTCYYSDMTTALESFLFILEKVESPDCWSFWMQRFKEYVYPALKQISHTHKAPGIIGKIAGKLHFLIPQLSTEIFSYFTNDNISPLISLNFLMIVLADYPSSFILNVQQETAVIQSWIKVCMLSTESYSHLTRIITKLDSFPLNLKSHINSSEDPLRAFVEYLGSDIKTHQQSNSIHKLCELCFGNIDKWLPQYLNNPDNESVVFRIYISLSLAFLHCGPLLYNRNRSSTPLMKLMQCLLLSSNVLIGKPPHEYILNSVKKTWHLFYEALVNLKTDCDMFLERTLRDMIIKYMPYFSSGESPIIKCLENEVTAEVVLEKISNGYFKHPVKETDNNLLKVIKILSDTVQSTTSVSLLKSVVNKTLCGLFELVIFHPQRSLAINFIKIITQSPLYPQVKLDFIDCVVNTTERHMSFNAINYFQMMYILAKFIPRDIETILRKVSQQVSHVERLRGVGYDVNLRSQLEKLENMTKEVQ